WYVFFHIIPIVPETFRLYDFSSRQGVLFLLVSQAWSLSLEFGCLLIAPFVLKSNKRYIVAIFLFSGAACLLFMEGIYRNYVLSTTIFFLLGSVAYRIYRRWYATWKITLIHKMLISFILCSLLLY